MTEAEAFCSERGIALAELSPDARALVVMLYEHGKSQDALSETNANAAGAIRDEIRAAIWFATEAVKEMRWRDEPPPEQFPGWVKWFKACVSWPIQRLLWKLFRGVTWLFQWLPNQWKPWWPERAR